MPTALDEIIHYINLMLADVDYNPHLDTLNHLNKIKGIAVDGLEEMDSEEESSPASLEDKIIFSCDASTREGASAIGVVCNLPEKKSFGWSMRLPPSSNTSTKAEYDAIYEAVKKIEEHKATFTKLAMPIEIRSDCKLAINQLNSKQEIASEGLARRKEAIKQLHKVLETVLEQEITFVWYPRNTTPALKEANRYAQTELGVSNH